jgi:hypothetical protein
VGQAHACFLCTPCSDTFALCAEAEFHLGAHCCLFGACTVCGDSSISISVYDLLDGTCFWIGGAPGSGSTQFPCNQPPFGQACGSFGGSLYIVYAQGTGGRLEPNTQAYLDTMGLGQINSVYSLIITRVPSAWGGTIAPVFLSSLVQVTRDLFVRKGNDPDPTFPITAVPGLANIRQIANTTFVYDTLITRGDLFASLQCVGGGLGFFADSQLTTLDGMNNLVQVNYVPIYFSGPTINIATPNAITTPAALAPLSRAANCGGPPPGLLPSILIAGCPTPIATWDALCTYIASGACP